MIVRRKQCFCTADFLIGNMLQYCPSNTEAVERTGAAADFIEDQKTVCGSIVENICHLAHFDHKGALSGGKIVACADAGKDPVDKSDLCFCRRNKRPNMRH